MNKNHLNQVQDQIMYRHPKTQPSVINETTLRNSMSTSSGQDCSEAQSIKEEVIDIIFKSTQFFNQLKQKA